jgi:dTDP-4-dehydrorhamnose reductase
MTQRRVLVTGAGGQLGRDLVVASSGDVPHGGLRGDARTGRLGDRPALDVVAAPRSSLDVARREDVLEVFYALRPDIVIHTAAFTAVDACEADPDRAFTVNAIGTRNVAEGARRYGAHLVVISTDYVFDGTSPRPYVEWDQTHPLSVYGRSKLGGEMEAGPGSTIVRTSWVNGVHGQNFVRTVMGLASDPSRQLRFVNDQRGKPTFTADLAGAVLSLADSMLPGVFHVTNGGEATWFDLARAVLRISGGDPDRVQPISTSELDPPRPAPRPANSVLDNAAMRLSGLPLLPEWEDALERMIRSLSGVSIEP